MATVTIIGAGMMGSALAFPARENGHCVRVVEHRWIRKLLQHAKQPESTPSSRYPSLPAWSTIK